MGRYIVGLLCAASLWTGSLSADTFEAAKEQDGSAAFHYWHCTAYDPHGHGYSATDVHYDHAYHAAVHSCEHSSGHHCHDVHCHEDH